MVGWLIVGASLIYLVPLAAHAVHPSALTDTWMETLARGGYAPNLALTGGGVALVLTAGGNALWYKKFEGKKSAGKSV